MTIQLDEDQLPEPARSWLLSALASDASDLHLAPGYPPYLRVHGDLRSLAGQSNQTGPELDAALMALLPENMIEQLRVDRNLDFSLQINSSCFSNRARVNLFLSGGHIGACFRFSPGTIPDLDWAGFPGELARKLTQFRNGLVLLTGITGSGKSTTLAMLINMLNQEGGFRIITVEEPVEYIFPRAANSVITQREVGTDVSSFAEGLKYGLRQDPDVMLVGEIRDVETAQIALSAAETGHLVFATLHTRDAKGAISRFADIFPQSVQAEIRAQLAASLRAVVCQHLLPSSLANYKRELALEVLFNSSPIAASIRVGKLESIDNYIMTSRAEGMIPLDESIKRLLADGRITAGTAEHFVSDRSLLRGLLAHAGSTGR